MRIAVVVSEWEQTCCGGPFRVGGTVSWQLLAADPAGGSKLPPPAVGLDHFVEEHHGQTPADVPHMLVEGTVRAVWGVQYPEIAVPGEPSTFIHDITTPLFVSLNEVDGGEGGFVKYLVTLEIGPGTLLPRYVLSEETIAWKAKQARDRDRDRARMSDEVGIVLEQTARNVASRYRGVVDVAQSSHRSAVTVTPHRTGAATVRWARSDQDTDGIGVHVGPGSWWLDATVSDAKAVELIVAAAAAGSVADDVVRLTEGGYRLDTRVSVGGRVWVATTGHVPPPNESGMMFVAGNAWERVQKGPTRYNPWGISD